MSAVSAPASLNTTSAGANHSASRVGSSARDTEQHREQHATVSEQLVARLAALRKQADQRATIDQGRGHERNGDAAHEDDAERYQRPQVAAKSPEEIGESRFPPRSCAHAAARKPTVNTGFSTDAASFP